MIARRQRADRRRRRAHACQYKGSQPTETPETAMVKYRLYYWPGIQGRGEFIRLALEDAGAGYVDVLRRSGTSSFADLPQPPFAMPYLVAGKKVIAQTSNILQYLGP